MKLATPPLAVAVVVPCSVPVPTPRAAVTIVLLSLLRRLPNASSIRTTGCCAKATPAVAVLEGCVWIVKRPAAAALTTTFEEVAPVKPALLKLRFMVSATV